MHDGHVHSHEHIHQHEHSHDNMPDLAKTRTLLTYMLDHNRHHAEELRELAHALTHLDQFEAAALITDGINFFSDGNDKLEAALEQLKEEI